MSSDIQYGHTLCLDDAWDLTLDSGGGIKTATGAYAVAQDVANAVRLFTNDAWFEPERGIPHFSLTLGRRPEPAVIRARFKEATLGVDGVASVTDIELDVENRVLTGDISFTLESGEEASVTL